MSARFVTWGAIALMALTVPAAARLMFRPINPRRLDDYLRRDRWVQGSSELRGRIAAANELTPHELSDSEVADLVAFLRALTDPASRHRPGRRCRRWRGWCWTTAASCP